MAVYKFLAFKGFYIQTNLWPVGYKIAYEFTKEASKDAKEKIPIYFLRYVMQHGINLEEENGSDIGYSEYKIWRFPCRVEVKLLKYGGLHPMSLGRKEDRYEEVLEKGGGRLMFG